MILDAVRVLTWLRTLAFAPLASIAFVAALVAQTPPRGAPERANATTALSQRYRYRLLGVYDESTGEPVADVEVRDVLSGLSSLTTETGTVSLLFLPDGGSLVRLRKIGYEMQTLAIAISPVDTNPITVIMRQAVQLPTVVVKDSAPTYRSPSLQAAENRLRSHAGGYFIDETKMRKWDNSTLGNAILSQMAGLVSKAGPHGEMYLLSARASCAMALSCASSNCYPTVYVDGIKFMDPAAPSGSSRLDFSRLSPMDYAIAEFYPGPATLPVEFRGGPCGVLLLWSRDR